MGGRFGLRWLLWLLRLLLIGRLLLCRLMLMLLHGAAEAPYEAAAGRNGGHAPPNHACHGHQGGGRGGPRSGGGREGREQGWRAIFHG